MFSYGALIAELCQVSKLFVSLDHAMQLLNGLMTVFFLCAFDTPLCVSD